ncbi:MAG TPA: glycosyltransferase family 4 protein [Thermoanaerobaculia bacterium]|nr:glycosyltransferase family 4 protein [Thermoanaerobaculia bacterium]
MKLLIVYETVYPDFIGGVELRNYELAAALCRRGHEVTLAGFCSGLTSTVENLHILSLGELGGLYNRAGRRSTRQALRFAAVVRRLDLAPYDAVETPSVPYVHLLPLAWKCAAAGKPLLVTWYEHWGAYWRGYVGRLRAPAYRAVEWLSSQLGTAVTATSDLTRGRLAAARRRRRGAAAAGSTGLVDLVPCGITVSRVRAAAGGRPGNGPPLIYAGRLLEHKRLDLLLRAVQLLALGESGTDAAGPLLTVFGEGPDRPRLEALAGELGIAGRVVFCGHVKSSEEVWRELGRARLAVQPSAREGFGLFPLEAMAAGLPVVYCGSPESAVGELVRDGVEGLAVAAEPRALAAALAALLAPAGEAERRRLGRNAEARAAHYDWDEIAGSIEAICLGLMARAARRRR